MGTTKSDQQLIKDYLGGNEGALSEIINRYLKPIYNFIYRAVGRNNRDIDDIVQESFLKVWKNLDKYNPDKSFKTWIFTIARNTAIDFLRKRREVLFSEFIDEHGDNQLVDTISDPEPLPDEIIIKIEQSKLLDDLLNQLPLVYKEILVLRYQEDLTFDEIGKILQKPLNTVKSQHRRALITLRKIIEKLT